jgi:protein gp37
MAQAARWSDLIGKDRKDKPWLDGLPRLIFVSDMSDALSSVVPFEFLENEVICNVTSPNGQRHQWLWLTKRPDRMFRFSETLKKKGVGWPNNLWAGTSVTTQGTTNRIKHLLRVGGENTIRFLSVEPQRAKIRLLEWLPRLNWVIHGGESGSSACPFRLEWALDLIEQCNQAGVAYFLKQLGSMVLSKDQRLRFQDSHGGDWSEWPNGVRVRQMPRRFVATLCSEPFAQNRNGKTWEADPRIPLELVEDGSKGRQAALKAWETRRENEQKKKRSEAARRAGRARNEIEENGPD